MDWILTIGDSWLTTLGWLAGLAVAFGMLVRLMPCNPGMYWWKDLRAVAADFMYWFLVPLFLRLCRMLMLMAGMALLFGDGDPQFLAVKDLPLWQQCLLILLIQDVILYGMHRVFHSRLAWPFHAIHHSPKTLDWTSTQRFHPINHLLEFTLADVAVLLLGFSPAALVLVTPFNIIYSALVHANLNWTFGPLRYIFASPVFHRWHHTTQEEGLNKNFASTFPVLDLIFGTFHMPAGKVPEHFGNGELDFPEDFWGQLIHPFRKKKPQPEIDSSDESALDGNRRTRSRVWGHVIGVAMALTVIGLVVFSVIRGQTGPKRALQFSRARDYFNGKEYGRAVDEYSEVIRRDPKCALAYANRAAAYCNRGDIERAIDDCNRAIQLDPRLAVAYTNRGGAYLTRGNFGRAIADCTRAIELDPKVPLAFANRGGAHLNRGDYDHAIADCSRALLLDPRLVIAYLSRASAFLGKGDFDGTILDCDQALRLNPHLASAYASRGAAHFNKGEDRQGVADYSRAIELDPRLTVAYANRGGAYLNWGVYDRAITDCTHAIELDPRLAVAYWNRGLAYARKGDPQRAEADQKKALELDSSLGQP